MVLAAFVAVLIHEHRTPDRTVHCLSGVACGSYDIILVAGQSNATSRGKFNGEVPVANNDRIWQVGRRSMPGTIIPASEPLEHVTYAPHGVGFALAFARAYRDKKLAPNRSILILPVAKGSTSVVDADAYWRPGGPGIAEANSLLTAVLTAYPNSRLVAVLWHQGESDRDQTRDVYVPRLKATLGELRKEGVPLVMGHILPHLHGAAMINGAVNDVARQSGAAVARSAGLTSLPNDELHFDGPSQLQLGLRYFCGFMRLAEPSSSFARSDQCKAVSRVAKFQSRHRS